MTLGSPPAEPWGSFLEVLEAELDALERASNPLEALAVVEAVRLPERAGPLPEAHRERAELLLRRLAGAQTRVLDAMVHTAAELTATRARAARPEIAQYVDARA